MGSESDCGKSGRSKKEDWREEVRRARKIAFGFISLETESKRHACVLTTDNRHPAHPRYRAAVPGAGPMRIGPTPLGEVPVAEY